MRNTQNQKNYRLTKSSGNFGKILGSLGAGAAIGGAAVGAPELVEATRNTAKRVGAAASSFMKDPNENRFIEGVSDLWNNTADTRSDFYDYIKSTQGLNAGIGAGIGGLGGYGLASLLTKNKLARILAALAGAGIAGRVGHTYGEQMLGSLTRK